MLFGCTRALARPLLMVALVVAVLGMHHLMFSVAESPAHGMGSHHAWSADATATSDPTLIEAGTRGACCAAPTVVLGEDRAGGAGHTPVGEHGGHDLLHLCLAIMAALAGVALVLVAVIWPSSVGIRRERWPSGAGAAARPPPGPTLRRLAVLCVLRQ
ncbi:MULTISPECIES: DUF6153 family protein [Nocardia]|uniref:DUF6153 family protein n=1 Tax=Nocardia TaxID=1817 RepID=UPI000A6705B1|nr:MULTISPECIES: DUF6153 family protein [Nocardia]